MPLIKGCRPWNGARVQPFSSRDDPRYSQYSQILCLLYLRNAPSQKGSRYPPTTSFKKIFANYFNYAGRQFLIVGDRLFVWSMCLARLLGPPSLVRMHFFASFDHTLPLLECLKKFPQMLAQSLLPSSHRISCTSGTSNTAFLSLTSSNPTAAVKAAERLLMAYISPNEDLNNDSFLHALLQLRNTLDPDCDLFSAEIVFGHPLRDAFSFLNRLATFSNRFFRRTWREAWRAKEDALRVRAKRTNDALRTHTRPLRCGDRVFIQNQGGKHPRKRDKIGTVVEALDFDQYNIKVGSYCRMIGRN